MVTETFVTTEKAPTCIKCISWTAIFIGAFVAIGLNFLLYLFTAGLGLSAFSTSATGLVSLAVGGFIWLILCAYFSMLFAGWVAGMLARPYFVKRGLGVLHGFSAWCVALIIGMILASHLSMFASAGTPYVYVMSGSLPTVQTTSDESAPIVSSTPSGTKTSKVTVNPTKATNALGIGILASFFIFLVGALGSCVGGYLGIQPKGHYVNKTDVI